MVGIKKTTMAVNHLHRAAKVKNDEYYTLYEDIEYAMEKYKDCFNGKVVYLPCDDYRHSNFTKYFKDNFGRLGLKKLVCTNYAQKSLFGDNLSECSYHYEFDGQTEKVQKLKYDGDFASSECVKIMRQCDIVVTNPPFSIFNKLVKQITSLEKDYILLGTVLKINGRIPFELFLRGKLFTTNTKCHSMQFTNGKGIGNCIWYSNLDVSSAKEMLPKNVKYEEGKYEKYNGTDIICVNKIADIPYDYNGMLAVPLTILYYDFSEYEVCGRTFGHRSKPVMGELCVNEKVGNKYKFARLIIRRKVVNHFQK